MKVSKEYDTGFKDGLTVFAWWKDGEQMVGSCGTTLKRALEERKTLATYGLGLALMEEERND